MVLLIDEGLFELLREFLDIDIFVWNVWWWENNESNEFNLMGDVCLLTFCGLEFLKS